MSKNLLIVFAKNIILGKVKTRLAKTIGNENAFDVYKFLVQRTEENTSQLRDCDIHIYFSDVIIESKWKSCKKFVQKGNDLGEKMKDAFQNSFDSGYKNVVGIGTDIPDLNTEIIENSFQSLDNSETVFGPAEDGGYYLLGMKKLHPSIFDNKEWSTPTLLKKTLNELNKLDISFSKLTELNDIDTIEDLEKSSIKFLLKKLNAY